MFGAIGRWFKAVWYKLTGQIDQARRGLDTDPHVMRAKFDEIIKGKVNQIHNYKQAVAKLIAQQEKKMAKVKSLTEEVNKLEDLKAGALAMARKALAKLQADGLLECDPAISAIAAVSVGVVNGVPVLDLPYVEDVAAEVDMNIVMNANGEFIELQGTGEKNTFSDGELATMLAHGRKGIDELLDLQKAAISEG